MAKEAKKLTSSDNLTLAGGVALNCVANGVLENSGIFKNIFIQPAAGDAGGALGAALAAYHIYYDKNRVLNGKMDAMLGSYLGPEFSDKETIKMSKKHKAIYNHYNNEDELIKKVAS